MKTSWSDTSIFWPTEVEYIVQIIFYMCFHRVSHVNKTSTHGYNLCGAVSYFSLNGLHDLVVKLMLFICGRIGYNNSWNLILAPVTHHCLSSWVGGSDFLDPSLVHSDIIHVSDNVFCEDMSALLQNFSIFLPIMLYSIKYICP